jgi:hypothetical protein
MKKIEIKSSGFLGIIWISTQIFCSSTTKDIYSSTTLKVDSILIDTTYGYPYPKNYNWEEWVKNGEYSSIPVKNEITPKPLVCLMNSKDDELYRIIFGIYKITIHTNISNHFINIQKDSVTSWNRNSPWSFPDSIHKINRDKNLSTGDFSKVMKLISKIKLFSKTTIDSTPRIVDDGFDMEIEGIKNDKYNLLIRVNPNKNYESDMYRLLQFMGKIVGEKE